MNERDRVKLIKKLDNFNCDSIYERTELLDQLIWENYNCKHEYGIRRDAKKSECLCLDCGEAISEFSYQKLYNIDSKSHLSNVRNRYLELLQVMNSQDSVSELSKEQGLTLRRTINYVTIK